uniref:Uncharacterized protein n=1 Tax=Oryza rufipogon TaxID=4529 RepID=A0A0E0QRM3_ORYRU
MKATRFLDSLARTPMCQARKKEGGWSAQRRKAIIFLLFLQTLFLQLAALAIRPPAAGSGSSPSISHPASTRNATHRVAQS